MKIPSNIIEMGRELSMKMIGAKQRELDQYDSMDSLVDDFLAGERLRRKSAVFFKHFSIVTTERISDSAVTTTKLV